jgi:hypothetical protein
MSSILYKCNDRRLISLPHFLRQLKRGCKLDDFGALLAAETGSPLALLYLTKVATKRKKLCGQICLLTDASELPVSAANSYKLKPLRS